MTLSPDSVHYFFSTGAQCFAAIAGLSATFAIFRYQGLLASMEARAEKIYRAFEKQHPFGFLIDVRDRLNLSNMTTHGERVDWLNVYFKDSWTTPLPEKEQKAFEQKFFQADRPKAVEESLKLNIPMFLGWKMEFDEFYKTRSSARQLRLWAIATGGFGLIMVVLGIVGTLLPDAQDDCLVQRSVVGFLIFGISYCIATLRTTAIAFSADNRKP